MTPDRHTAHKARLAPLRAALYDGDQEALSRVLGDLIAENCLIQWGFPLESQATDLQKQIFTPLFHAIPDLERRDTIVTAGTAHNTPEGESDWVGCAGYYTGVMRADWLDIPAPHQQVYLRFHEFYRFDNNRIVEIQAIWDIPELMMQAGVWPMVPSLGLQWNVPGPATQDGLVPGPYDDKRSTASRDLVLNMLEGLKKSPQGDSAMQLDQYWHPKMNWYGPAGIGTARQISGFRQKHQIPFLKAMPNRTTPDDLNLYLFGDGDYVAVTGWPNMRMTISGDGWLGIAPSGQEITLRSLDFWRCERGLIRENWVLVDLLDMYRQIGVDVFARLRERIPR